MKIACLQFAPQVGDVDHNLNRADAVLSRAENLEDLDLLVLPELAFSGYNFKSLNHISPYLEHSGSGISSLWARTMALKYDCTVIVGYPEKVDVAPKWPTSPEYYNSAIMVNSEGETIANYRKAFLYSTDETWALEGGDGFHDGFVPGLGTVAMGICMDINPYKFEAPWHAFEFAFHVLEVEANVVIITMAWVTREDPRSFSRMPQEPDMDTLTYWVQRLEPLIRAEREEEIIVILYNRCGTEDDVTYAGTSAVLGIKEGEVNVYGLLGRGVKDLLVVDTSERPYAKLVRRAEVVLEGSETSRRQPREPQNGVPNGNNTSATQGRPSGQGGAGSDSSHSNGASGADAGSKGNSAGGPKPSLGLAIPRYYASASRRSEPNTAIEESPVIQTPTAPSPTPQSLRPKFFFPSPVDQYPSPFPKSGQPGMRASSFIYGGDVAIGHDRLTPTTPSLALSPTAAYFWLQPEPSVQTPPEPDFKMMALGRSSPAASAAGSNSSAKSSASKNSKASKDSKKVPEQPEAPAAESRVRTPPADATVQAAAEQTASDQASTVNRAPSTAPEFVPPRPSSPKSRHASRTRHRDGNDPDSILPHDASDVTKRLEEILQHTDRASSTQPPSDESGQPARPQSPKSRNTSRTRFNGTPAMSIADRSMTQSQMSIPIAASPSIFSTGPATSTQRPQSVVYFRPGSHMSNRPASVSATDRPGPPRAPSSMANRNEAPENAAGEPAQTQSETSGSPQPPNVSNTHPERPMSRAASRGRPRVAKQSPTNGAYSPSVTAQREESITRRPSLDQNSPGSGTNAGNTVASGTPARGSSRKSSVAAARSPSQGGDPDEIIATIGRICHNCPVHGRSSTQPTAAPGGDDIVYQIELAPHLRELVESLANPGRSSTPTKSTGTPQPFNPPTPKAMDFGQDLLSPIPPAPLVPSPVKAVDGV